jgi:hypothetical protein
MSDYSEDLLEPLTEYKRILTEVRYRVGHREPVPTGVGLSLVKPQ